MTLTECLKAQLTIVNRSRLTTQEDIITFDYLTTLTNSNLSDKALENSLYSFFAKRKVFNLRNQSLRGQSDPLPRSIFIALCLEMYKDVIGLFDPQIMLSMITAQVLERDLLTKATVDFDEHLYRDLLHDRIDLNNNEKIFEKLVCLYNTSSPEDFAKRVELMPTENRWSAIRETVTRNENEITKILVKSLDPMQAASSTVDPNPILDHAISAAVRRAAESSTHHRVQATEQPKSYSPATLDAILESAGRSFSVQLH